MGVDIWSLVVKIIVFRLTKLYNYYETNNLGEKDSQRYDLVCKLIKEYGKIYE